MKELASKAHHSAHYQEGLAYVRDPQAFVRTLKRTPLLQSWLD